MIKYIWLNNNYCLSKAKQQVLGSTIGFVSTVASGSKLNKRKFHTTKNLQTQADITKFINIIKYIHLKINNLEQSSNNGYSTIYIFVLLGH